MIDPDSALQIRRRRLLLAGAALSTSALLPIRVSNAAGKSAVIAASLEISHTSSLSDDAILAGLNLAIQDLNTAAGTKGFSWELLTYDNGSIPGRGVAHLHEMAQRENLAGVFGGKFSTVVLAMMPIAKELRIPLFAPWSAADSITASPEQAQFVFRLSMRDGWAMSKLVDRAMQRGYRTLGLLTPNSSWGRSCVNAIEKKISMLTKFKQPVLTRKIYNWGGEPTMLPYYLALANAGADALVLVANEAEAALLASELVASLPANKRLPILSHWGIIGGDAIGQSKRAILELDISFVQTFNFLRTKTPAAASIATRAAKLLGTDSIHAFPAQVGIAHAYDLMMMIGTAISPLAKITGPAVAEAMTGIQSHQGIIKRYVSPYARGSRDALAESDIFFCRYSANGEIQPDP